MVLAHAPSLDCAGMVASESRIFMTAAKEGSTAKTSHVIQVVEDLRDDKGSVAKVGAQKSHGWSAVGVCT